MTAKPRPAAEHARDTRQRLLITALRLYAAEGLYAVSLRRISAEAGSKNSAAMHYHFHNKFGVIEALVAMIAGELAIIDARLRAGEPAPDSMREACRSILLPLTRLPRAQHWGRDALRFMSRLVSDSDPATAATINQVYAPFWQRMDKALSSRVPGLPADVRQLRLLFMSTNVLHGVAEVAWLAHSPLGDLSHFDDDSLLDHLVDYLIGGLMATTSRSSTATTDKRSHHATRS
jgi:AcrR family transcriptional regulator